MSRRSAFGAFHPVFFMLMVYVISFFLAFFVCRTIYSSLHPASSQVKQAIEPTNALTVLK